MYHEQIIQHYKSNWKGEPSIYLWDKGPIEKLPGNFRVLEFAPTSERDMWTYATCGMSKLDDIAPIELHLFSSVKEVDLVELLTIVAYYHRNTQMLNLNHFVNLGRAWVNESICKYGFISLPFLDGPALEDLYVKGSKRVTKFYWLIPVTEAEKDYSLNYGIEALEKKFDLGLNYLDSKRKSMV